MNFTLITSKGKIMTFFGFEAAVIFQQAYGGVIITNDILKTQSATNAKA